jgi:hypothetical protein
MTLVFEGGEKLCGKENKLHTIYGDDFKIEVVPVNKFEGRCALTISDYDEFQNLEYQTVLDFSKKELNHLINILVDTRDNMLEESECQCEYESDEDMLEEIIVQNCVDLYVNNPDELNRIARELTYFDVLVFDDDGRLCFDKFREDCKKTAHKLILERYKDFLYVLQPLVKDKLCEFLYES